MPVGLQTASTASASVANQPVQYAALQSTRLPQPNYVPAAAALSAPATVAAAPAAVQPAAASVDVAEDSRVPAVDAASAAAASDSADDAVAAPPPVPTDTAAVGGGEPLPLRSVPAAVAAAPVSASVPAIAPPQAAQPTSASTAPQTGAGGSTQGTDLAEQASVASQTLALATIGPATNDSEVVPVVGRIGRQTAADGLDATRAPAPLAPQPRDQFSAPAPIAASSAPAPTSAGAGGGLSGGGGNGSAPAAGLAGMALLGVAFIFIGSPRDRRRGPLSPSYAPFTPPG
jgi:hypothetical protein